MHQPNKVFFRLARFLKLFCRIAVLIRRKKRDLIKICICHQICTLIVCCWYYRYHCLWLPSLVLFAALKKKYTLEMYNKYCVISLFSCCSFSSSFIRNRNAHVDSSKMNIRLDAKFDKLSSCIIHAFNTAGSCEQFVVSGSRIRKKTSAHLFSLFYVCVRLYVQIFSTQCWCNRYNFCRLKNH